MRLLLGSLWRFAIAALAIIPVIDALPQWLGGLRRDYVPAAYNPVYGPPAGYASYTWGGYGPRPTSNSSSFIITSSSSSSLSVLETSLAEGLTTSSFISALPSLSLGPMPTSIPQVSLSTGVILTASSETSPTDSEITTSSLSTEIFTSFNAAGITTGTSAATSGFGGTASSDLGLLTSTPSSTTYAASSIFSGSAAANVSAPATTVSTGLLLPNYTGPGLSTASITSEPYGVMISTQSGISSAASSRLTSFFSPESSSALYPTGNLTSFSSPTSAGAASGPSSSSYSGRFGSNSGSYPAATVGESPTSSTVSGSGPVSSSLMASSLASYYMTRNSSSLQGLSIATSGGGAGTASAPLSSPYVLPSNFSTVGISGTGSPTSRLSSLSELSGELGTSSSLGIYPVPCNVTTTILGPTGSVATFTDISSSRSSSVPYPVSNVTSSVLIGSTGFSTGLGIPRTSSGNSGAFSSAAGTSIPYPLFNSTSPFGPTGTGLANSASLSGILISSGAPQSLYSGGNSSNFGAPITVTATASFTRSASGVSNIISSYSIPRNSTYTYGPSAIGTSPGASISRISGNLGSNSLPPFPTSGNLSSTYGPASVGTALGRVTESSSGVLISTSSAPPPPLYIIPPFSVPGNITLGPAPSDIGTVTVASRTDISGVLGSTSQSPSFPSGNISTSYLTSTGTSPASIISSNLSAPNPYSSPPYPSGDNVSVTYGPTGTAPPQVLSSTERSGALHTFSTSPLYTFPGNSSSTFGPTGTVLPLGETGNSPTGHSSSGGPPYVTLGNFTSSQGPSGTGITLRPSYTLSGGGLSSRLPPYGTPANGSSMYSPGTTGISEGLSGMNIPGGISSTVRNSFQTNFTFLQTATTNDSGHLSSILSTPIYLSPGNTTSSIYGPTGAVVVPSPTSYLSAFSYTPPYSGVANSTLVFRTSGGEATVTSSTPSDSGLLATPTANPTPDNSTSSHGPGGSGTFGESLTSGNSGVLSSLPPYAIPSNSTLQHGPSSSGIYLPSPISGNSGVLSSSASYSLRSEITISGGPTNTSLLSPTATSQVGVLSSLPPVSLPINFTLTYNSTAFPSTATGEIIITAAPSSTPCPVEVNTLGSPVASSMASIGLSNSTRHSLTVTLFSSNPSASATTAILGTPPVDSSASSPISGAGIGVPTTSTVSGNSGVLTSLSGSTASGSLSTTISSTSLEYISVLPSNASFISNNSGVLTSSVSSSGAESLPSITSSPSSILAYYLPPPISISVEALGVLSSVSSTLSTSSPSPAPPTIYGGGYAYGSGDLPHRGHAEDTSRAIGDHASPRGNSEDDGHRYDREQIHGNDERDRYESNSHRRPAYYGSESSRQGSNRYPSWSPHDRHQYA